MLKATVCFLDNFFCHRNAQDVKSITDCLTLNYKTQFSSKRILKICPVVSLDGSHHGTQSPWQQPG